MQGASAPPARPPFWAKKRESLSALPSPFLRSQRDNDFLFHFREMTISPSDVHEMRTFTPALSEMMSARLRYFILSA